MFVLLMVALLAVVVVMVMGIFLMMRGGEANKKYSQKLMVLRVSLQAVALVVLGVLFLMGKS